MLAQLRRVIEMVPEVIPHLSGRAWWLGLSVEEAKTVEYYVTILKQSMRRMYNNEVNQAWFTEHLAGYVERQFRRAWNEGMRLNGLNPPGDMTDAWEAIYQDLVVSEYEYIDRLGAQLEVARKAGDPLEPFLRRAELWGNRYTEVVNISLATTKPDQLLMWQYGATEDHCTDCAARVNTVKTGKEWAADIMPQSRELECGGWRCDCRLVSGFMGQQNALDKQYREMLFAPAELFR